MLCGRSWLIVTLNLLENVDVSVETTTDVKTRTFAELRRDVAVLAAAMRKMGIQKNDRVVGGCSTYILHEGILLHNLLS